MNHLNAEQVDALKAWLNDERTRLRAEIRDELMANDQEHYGDLAGQVHDAGDESVADLLADANISAIGRSITELREVEAALDRINEGSYGLCQDCGEEIPYGRMEAYPTARRCLDHQEQYEHTHAEPAPRL